LSGKRANRLISLTPLFAERKNDADILKISCIDPKYTDFELVVQYCHARLAYETKLFFFTKAGGVFLCLHRLVFALGGRLIFAHGRLDDFDLYLH
jgi:hypothetical protein